MSIISTHRREWIDMTKKRLDELDERLQQAEEQASAVRTHVSAELHGQLTSVRASLDAALRRWTIIRDSASELWDAVSEEIRIPWNANRLTL